MAEAKTVAYTNKSTAALNIEGRTVAPGGVVRIPAERAKALGESVSFNCLLIDGHLVEGEPAPAEDAEAAPAKTPAKK